MSKYIKQADENAEIGMRTQIEPIIEVSEDCISREYLSDKVGRYYAERGDFGSFECYWILDAIKDAPSVVPKLDK